MTEPRPPRKRAKPVAGDTATGSRAPFFLTTDAPLFLTTEQAARVLGVSAKTVQLWTDEGHLASTRTPGGHRRIPMPALERALQAREASMGTLVLVVEDDPALARWYELALGGGTGTPGGGLEVSVSTDGMQALLRIAKERPDVVVTDLRMSPLNGFDLMDAILSDPEVARSIRLIVVTGLSEIELASSTRLPSCAMVLRKPVTEAQLRKAIASVRASRSAPVQAP